MHKLVKALGSKTAPKYPKRSYDLIWNVPFPYTKVEKVGSMRCPGLDPRGIEIMDVSGGKLTDNASEDGLCSHEDNINSRYDRD